MKHGVPEERAASMSRIERLAWLVSIGISEGGKWNWHTKEWEKPGE